MEAALAALSEDSPVLAAGLLRALLSEAKARICDADDNVVELRAHADESE